jgi:hypothetical protein
MPTNVPVGRDLRLDLFRGIALWLIFLDHIPFNVVNWVTIRNYGFSDAAEIFVFISGYTAAFVYARAMREKGPIGASARILKRAWQVYVAHVFLFVIYLAEISYVGAKFDNPLFAEEFNLFGFLRSPDVILTQALILKFKPVNMDVLPLYIVLLLAFPPLLWSLLRSPNLALLGSGILYVLARKFGWNLPAFPAGKWYFNPFAWQFLFVFGAWCALGGAQQLAWALRSRIVLAIAVAYLLYRYVPALSWWEIPVYGIVFSGMAGYFVSFVGDKYVLFHGWDFVFPLLVWPALLGFAFLVLGATLHEHRLPRQVAILGVLLTLSWSWGVDLAQSLADYSTTYNYGTSGQRETAAFLDQILKPGEPYVAPRDVAYYVHDDVFVDQDVWQAYVEQLGAQGVSQFDGHLRLGPGADYDVRTVAVFLWEPSLGKQAHSVLDPQYDVI